MFTAIYFFEVVNKNKTNEKRKLADSVNRINS